MAVWINFKELRERIRIADLLRQHNVELKVRGEKATGLYPLPTHPSRGDGKKRSPSFSVHLGKGIWHCFGCGAKQPHRTSVIPRFAYLLTSDDPCPYTQVLASKVLKFVLLAALLLQCGPLRICAVEEIMLGTSCHERFGVADRGPSTPMVLSNLDGHSSPIGGGDEENCVCNRERDYFERSKQMAITVDPPLLTLIAFTPVGCPEAFLSASDPLRRPPRFVAEYILPLLI